MPGPAAYTEDLIKGFEEGEPKESDNIILCQHIFIHLEKYVKILKVKPHHFIDIIIPVHVPFHMCIMHVHTCTCTSVCRSRSIDLF